MVASAVMRGQVAETMVQEKTAANVIQPLVDRNANRRAQTMAPALAEIGVPELHLGAPDQPLRPSKAIPMHDSRTLPPLVRTTGKGVRSASGFACLLLTLTLTVHAGTTVYKVRHADGSVSYSDVPSEQAEVMQVEPVTTIPAVRLPAEGASPEPPEPVSAAYQSFDITAPAADSAFFSADGNVHVVVALTPALKPGHRLEYWLDGELKGSTPTPSITLNALFRGTHTLQVKIVDPGNNLIDSRQSSFTVQRPMVRN
jgi:hypothetical protein